MILRYLTNNIAELLEAVLMGPYRKLLRKEKEKERFSSSHQEEMYLMRPTFDTLKERRDVMREEENNLILAQTSMETDRFLTPEFVMSETDSESD